jgi:hypothetical protein
MFRRMLNRSDSINSVAPFFVVTLRLAAVVAALAIAAAAPSRLAAQPSSASATDFVRGAPAPSDYVLSRFSAHRVVLLGEPHWVMHDVELLATVVPRLLDAQVNTFAAEWLSAREQGRLDALMRSSTWNDAEAMAVLRAGAWPYKEYLDVLHAAWQANRARSGSQPELRVLGLGPEINWREQLLPIGKTYDSFMAERVAERLNESKVNRVLVALGFHHAFTRYMQPDLPSGPRATRFNDRTGNFLWRMFGEDVFMVILHHPWYCRSGATWGRCLPLGGAIDCAAAAAGGRAVGFDIAACPFAGSHIDSNVWYGAGYPFLRFDALADGYVWTRPVERYEGASLIPLDVYAPDERSLAEVLANNPVSDTPAKTRDDLKAQWAVRAAELKNFVADHHWDMVAGWQDRCPR